MLNFVSNTSKDNIHYFKAKNTHTIALTYQLWAIGWNEANTIKEYIQ